MNQKFFIIVASLLTLGAVCLVLFMFILKPNSALYAPIPPSPLPSAEATVTPSTEPSPSLNSNRPTVTAPEPNSKVSSPLQVKGTIPPGWMFEGIFPVKLLDSDRNLITQVQGRETTPGSWSSGQPIEFSANLTFSTGAKSGFLILEKDNPSGLPENVDSFEIRVYF